MDIPSYLESIGITFTEGSNSEIVLASIKDEIEVVVK